MAPLIWIFCRRSSLGGSKGLARAGNAIRAQLPGPRPQRSTLLPLAGDTSHHIMIWIFFLRRVERIGKSGVGMCVVVEWRKRTKAGMWRRRQLWNPVSWVLSWGQIENPVEKSCSPTGARVIDQRLTLLRFYCAPDKAQSSNNRPCLNASLSHKRNCKITCKLNSNE